jgi:hypothetical protein
MVTVNRLADMIIAVSGKGGLTLRHVAGPQGVRGRNSDNSRLREVLGWEPSVALSQGLEPTYRWIEKQVQPGRPRAGVRQRVDQLAGRAGPAPASPNGSTGGRAVALDAGTELDT